MIFYHISLYISRPICKHISLIIEKLKTPLIFPAVCGILYNVVLCPFVPCHITYLNKLPHRRKTMKKATKALVWLLAVLMLVSALAACTPPAPDEETTAETTAPTIVSSVPRVLRRAFIPNPE